MGGIHTTPEIDRQIDKLTHNILTALDTTIQEYLAHEEFDTENPKQILNDMVDGILIDYKPQINKLAYTLYEQHQHKK